MAKTKKPQPAQPKAARRASAGDPPATDMATTIGEGGEVHQQADDPATLLTTNQGVPVSDNQNSLKAGARGPVLLQDFILREKIMHFDHERIPERVVHARGSAAHGFFECLDACSDVTSADFLQRVGDRTPVFTRFSTVAGNKGSFDLARDVRGFAVKFYTQEGNFDLVGNNIPVFFIQDAIKFPVLIHAAKQDPDREFPQAQTAHDTFWDYISLTPESMHMIMWIMSDRAIPRSYRMMEGFGVHTFRLVDAAGASTFVKFHWRPKLGMQSVVWDEAVKINGADPDFHRRDLWEAIESGDFPEYEFCLQTFTQEQADGFDFDVLDATKVIPEEVVPLRVVGRMVLDRNPTNFFAETEQVAFCTANVVPGIDFTNDPLLQGRLFSYQDTQLTRLGGPNFHQIPINRPRCPLHNLQRDGHMQTQVFKGRANYEPNSLAEAGELGGPREDPKGGFRSFALPMEAAKVRLRAETFADHYSHARLFYRSQTPIEQAHLASAIVFELSKVVFEHVRERVLANLGNVDPDLAKRVAAGLNAPLPAKSEAAVKPQDMDPSPALRIVGKYPDSLRGRAVGILVTDGADGAVVAAVRKAAEAEGATVKIVAPKIGGVTLKGGKALKADGQLAGSPSVVFDAVALVLSDEGCAQLLGEGAAIGFVHDAFGHLKAIGFTPEAQPLLDKAGVVPDAGVVDLTGGAAGFIAPASTRQWDREPKVRMLACASGHGMIVRVDASGRPSP
ncbi:MAG: Catalase [Phenylobacterium sp.]|nr:Catalase [Phenylobacterium sp.]